LASKNEKDLRFLSIFTVKSIPDVFCKNLSPSAVAQCTEKTFDEAEKERGERERKEPLLYCWYQEAMAFP